MKHFLKSLIFALLVLMTSTANAQTLAGTTWSHSIRGGEDNVLPAQTTYFAFTSSTKVIVYMEAERNYLYPIGFGTYNPSKQTIIFSETDPLNIMSRRVGQTLVWGFRLKNGNAEIFDPTGADKSIMILTKEKYSLIPSSSLTETKWIVSQCSVDDYKGQVWKFANDNMLIVNHGQAGASSFAYVCFNNMVSIAFDSDEAFFGEISYDGNTITLCFGSAFDRMSDETYIVLQKTE